VRRPWALALLAGGPLVAGYLILAPPAGDLAAAVYRSELFARVGLSTWDTGWYAAHGYWLLSYSLLSPALGAWLGVRALLAICALASCALFGAIAERTLPPASARASAVVFALGFCVGLLSGRVPFDLGFAIGLGALLALLLADRGSRRSSVGAPAPALGLALLASAASPVAGAFLALAGLALGLVGERRGLALAACALAPILVLGLLYPNGGYEPFAASAFWPALAGVVLIALLLPSGDLGERGRGVVRAGAALYAVALIAAYALRTPMGGNAARLGALLAAPLLAGALWRRHRLVLAALAAPLLYWQLATPIRDYAALANDPSVRDSYYAPLRAELRRLTGGRATIVEVPMTRAHWESAHLAGHDGVRLARGWERQLDTRYGAIFYEPALSAAAYRGWLRANRVRYVALPDVPLDRAGAREGALVAGGAPYLREIWRSAHWRVYRFMG
jgi:hypothetical protein